MKDALLSVKTGEVTYAVRDTSINGKTIKKGDFMGISEKKIVSTGEEMLTVAKELLSEMIEDDSEIITILEGEDATGDVTSAIVTYLEETFAQIEVEVHRGNQPLYSYIFSVE